MRAYDYVIVGAGPAGCCLAARLSEDPDVSVLLLEAGGSDWHPYIRLPAGFAKLTGKAHTWGYSTAPQRAVDNRPTSRCGTRRAGCWAVAARSTP